MAEKRQSSGQAFKSLSLLLTPEEHRAAKIKAAEHDVTLADVLRLALQDESLWRRAAKAKAAAAKQPKADD